MKRFLKCLFILTILFSIVNIAMADRGGKKKSKSKIVLNIITPNSSSLRSSIPFNLNSGLSYKGSLLASQFTMGSSLMSSSIVTYQKGNTTYIIPYKHTLIMPDIRPGYSGIKIQFH
ncbi:MAG: hypothetical protein WDM71_10465 [Ferruginibacter sp.]